MTREKLIAELLKSTKKYADFISAEHIQELLPKERNDFFAEDVNHYKEILNHEISCLKEYIELANDMLQDITLNMQYEIRICHATL